MVATRTSALLLAVIGLALAAACAGDSEPAGPTPTPVAPTNGALTVVASEWDLEPETIVLQAGEEVTLTFDNEGEIVHNLKVDERVFDMVSQNSGGGFEADDDELLVGANSGDTSTITVVPLEPGQYEFYCNIANHRQLGMLGLMIVE